MGILDALKKLIPKGEPPPVMEPQCVRHRFLTVRLPTGWQFTQADERVFAASGPGGCLVQFLLAAINMRGGAKASEFEEHRKDIVRLVRDYFLESKSAEETIMPTGVMWMEATDVHAKDRRLRIVLLNTRPRNHDWLPPMLQVTCTMPGGSTTDKRFEELRAALRSVEWN